jgi:hypothetical protein
MERMAAEAVPQPVNDLGSLDAPARSPCTFRHYGLHSVAVGMPNARTARLAELKAQLQVLSN